MFCDDDVEEMEEVGVFMQNMLDIPCNMAVGWLLSS
jgi:hypothetical protein